MTPAACHKCVLYTYFPWCLDIRENVVHAARAQALAYNQSNEMAITVGNNEIYNVQNVQ